MQEAQAALAASQARQLPPPSRTANREARRSPVQVASNRPLPLPAPPPDDVLPDPAVVLVEARQLAGATPPMLARLLGEPSLQRLEGEAQAWLYNGRTCALDVFLYQDASGTSRVVHAAARSTGAGPRVTEAQCLQDLLGRPPLQES